MRAHAPDDGEAIQAFLASSLDEVLVLVRADQVARVELVEPGDADVEGCVDLAELLGIRPPVRQRRLVRVQAGAHQGLILVGPRASIERYSAASIQPLPAFVAELGRALCLEGILATPERFALVISVPQILNRSVATQCGSHGG